MKRTLLSLMLLVFTAGMAWAQQASGPDMTFEKKVHDFGTMKQHGDASCAFVFTNNGTEPLIISSARGSCGCTVPEWPREPIAPGQSSEIKVRYDSKRVGPINKSVTIESNAVDSPTMTLRIKGEIKAAPKEDGAPVNKTGAPVSGGSN